MHFIIHLYIILFYSQIIINHFVMASGRRSLNVKCIILHSACIILLYACIILHSACIILLYACITNETFLHDFLEIMKRLLYENPEKSREKSWLTLLQITKKKLFQFFVILKRAFQN